MSQPTIQQAVELAIKHHQAGRLREAEHLYRQVLARQPDNLDALHLLGVIAYQAGRSFIAVDLISQAIALKPNWSEAQNNLGSALRANGQLDDAIAAHRQAIALKPGNADAHNNLGTALVDKGQLDEAAAAYRQAIASRPNYAEAFGNLGNVLKEQGQLDEAIACYRQAVALRPNLPETHNNLGNVLKDKAQLDEAIAAYRQAVALNPTLAGADSNLIYTLYFHPAYTASAIVEEHRRWNRRHAEPLAKFIQPHPNDRDPGRRLKIGYVSPDLRLHPVGRFLLQLFAHHDHEHFEIHAYSATRKPDAITARLKQGCDHWHEIAAMPDEILAEQIRRDGIDILVDLSLHMALSRLLVFARKPAPVQATWLGYAGTTGLSTMDYRLSDPYLDPPGATDADYVEKIIRIPSYWCYQPMEQSPAPAPPPAINNGWITFGCLNNFCKVSRDTLHLWRDVLHAVENSRLLIHTGTGNHRDTILAFFAQNQIDSSRIAFVGYKSPAEYLLLYHQIDIALDTTPYSGGTTTCDALWMGVPTVTLAGKTAVGRGGVSLLSNMGLPELIAQTPQQYAQIAANLAGDPARLQSLRSTLRQQMQSSPLMDGKRFAQSMEAAYRQMWQNWCGKIVDRI